MSGKKKGGQGTVKLTQLCRKGSKVKLSSDLCRNIKMLHSVDVEEQQGPVPEEDAVTRGLGNHIRFAGVLVAWQVPTVVRVRQSWTQIFTGGGVVHF